MIGLIRITSSLFAMALLAVSFSAAADVKTYVFQGGENPFFPIKATISIDEGSATYSAVVTSDGNTYRCETGKLIERVQLELVRCGSKTRRDFNRPINRGADGTTLEGNLQFALDFAYLNNHAFNRGPSIITLTRAPSIPSVTAQSVVKVYSSGAPPQPTYEQVSSGSGFAISSDGVVVTNYHVVKGCQKLKVHLLGKAVEATTLFQDERNDIAIIKGDFRPKGYFNVSDKRPRLLQDIYVAGFPFGKDMSTTVKVTKGIISSLAGMENNYSNIQIDAALHQGNSGGPILDNEGKVVGVAVSRLDKMKAFKKYGQISENTNFGVKARTLSDIMESNNFKVNASSSKGLTKDELGKRIGEATYYLSCWMTKKQETQMQTIKVLFSNY